MPVHAAYGVGGYEFIQGGYSLPDYLSADVTFELQDLVASFYRVIHLDFWSVLLFGDEYHDFVVGRTSAQEQLDSAFLTDFHMEDGVHCWINKSALTESFAAFMLQAQIQIGNSLFAEALPAGRGARDRRSAPPIPPYGDVIEHGLVITSPPDGSVVSPGQVVTVVVLGQNGFDPVSAMLTSSYAVLTDHESPIEFQYEVAPAAIGPLTLQVFGFDSQNNVATAADITLQVDVQAALSSLSVAPDSVYLRSYAPKASLIVSPS